MKSIDGSDETVHHEAFQLNRSRPTLMERSDEAKSVCVMERINIAAVGS